MRRLLIPLFGVLLVVSLVAGLYWLAPRRDDPLQSTREAIDRREFVHASQLLDDHLSRVPGDAEARLLAAQTARRAGDFEAAEKHIQQYQQAGGDTVIVGLERGLRNVQSGNAAEAEALFAFCLAQPDHPATPFILEALGQGLLASGELVRSVICLDKWLERGLSPANETQALIWRGQGLEQLDLRSEAGKDYRRANEISPTHLEARLHLANYLAADEPQAAIHGFRRLKQESPDRDDVTLGLARCYRILGEYGPAQELVTALLSGGKPNAAILTEAGILEMERGRASAAEPLLRQATSLEPKQRQPLAQLIRCLRETGNESEANRLQAKLQQWDEERTAAISAMKRPS